jgi:hypothetical protein
MKARQWRRISAFTLLVMAFAFAESQGSAPRAAANKYQAHADDHGASIGATRLSSGQLRKVFSLDKPTSADLDDCCIVLEVGLYPARDGKLEVNLADFALRVKGEQATTRPSDSKTVVAQLPYWIQVGQSGHGGLMGDPRPQLDSPTGGVSRDPVTGMPRRTDGYPNRGVDVGSSPQEPTSKPEASPQRRELELKLAQKALPEGETATPVAGYIYFAVEKKKDAKYELEYKLNGKSVVLPL